jgi:hypothetical protein
MAAADRQLEVAPIAFDRQLWNEPVALSAAATERVLKAMLTSTPGEVRRNGARDDGRSGVGLHKEHPI